MKQMQQYEIYYYEDFQNFGIVTTSGIGTSGEIEFDEALQEAFHKVRSRGDFDELEVEGFLRERFTEMQATELSLKQEVH